MEIILLLLVMMHHSVSFVGYQTSTVAVNGQDQINFSLNQANELDEVVVTSLGIKREAKALGYSIQQLEVMK